MSEIKVVSIDMFQTLVDVNSRRHETWKEIVGEAYTYELAEKYWSDASKLVLKYFNESVYEKEFVTVKNVFRQCYNELFCSAGIDADPEQAALILAEQHGFSEIYEDSVQFINTVSAKYPVCLVSDADIDMVSPLLKLFEFDKVFISEELGAYKFEHGSKVFKEVIKHYGVEPENIIHIGDGYSDVCGARTAGIKACWLNRNGHKWAYDIKPDYEVKSLIDMIPILFQ